MLPYLAFLFAVVLMNIIYGIVKGLGKEKIFVPLLIFFYTSAVFVMWLLIEIGVGENSIPFGLLYRELSVMIVGIFIIGLADWRKEADVIANQTK